MRPARQLLRALLVPVCLLLGVSGEAVAQEHDDHAVRGRRHRSRTRCGRCAGPIRPPGRAARCRREGDAVTIARDLEVILDVAPPALRSLTVEGKLSFADDRDIGLETEWIYLRGGELQIGTEAKPHTRTRPPSP